MSSRRRRRAVALAMLAALASVVAAVACGVDLDGTGGGDGPDGGNPDGTTIDGPNGGDGDPTGDGGPGDGNAGDGSDGGVDAGPPPCTGDTCVVEISAGGGHTCAKRRNGQASCWGANFHAEITGTAGTTTGPTPIPAALGAVAHVIAGGTGIADLPNGNHSYGFTCAVSPGGDISCWGDNSVGELGRGDSLQDAGVVGIDAGGGSSAGVGLGWVHACAFGNLGLRCWGYNAHFQLGKDTSPNNTQPPLVVPLDASVSSVAGGLDHSCVVTQDGLVTCWGANDKGQVDPALPATDTAFTATSPTQTVVGASSISAGSAFTCAVISDGGTRCWGYNSEGQLGRSGTGRVAPGPVAIAKAITQISTGFSHACALLTDKTVWCWGRNTSGQCGQPASPKVAPTQVNVLPAIAIATGNAHSCAVLESGPVACWGANDEAQLGIADAGATSFMPVTVPIP